MRKGFRKGFSMALLLGSLSLAGNAAALEIVKDGRSDYVIVVAADAIPAEKTAAGELQKYIQQLAGVKLPIVNTPRKSGHNILLGCTPEFLALAEDPALDAEWLDKADSVLLTVHGGNLFISGNRPRGTLYAVYTLLEDFWGVRFWSAREESVPSTPRLELPDNLAYRYAPPFFSRETYFTDPNTNPAFAAKLKSNGDYQAIPPEWGGKVKYQNGFCHTATILLPPNRYFAEHPDWYALDESGKRNPEQLCWTNPEMRRELTEVVRNILRKHPDARIIAIDHMDGWLRCQCDDCRALEAEGGSPAAPVVSAVNEVAGAIAGEYPDVLIETLAYLFAQDPPMKLKVRDNVLIRLCAFLNDFSRSYDSDVNADFRDDLKAWPQIADKLAIWDYLGNYTNFMIPHPNIRFLGDNIRLYADNHVAAVFSQGDVGTGNCGDFLLKGWVVGHLLWNPQLDQRALMREFLDGYYSPAVGARLLEITDQLCDDFEATGLSLGCYRFDANDWLSYERIQEILRAFSEMEQLLAAEPEAERQVYLERLRRARLPFEVAFLTSAESCGWNPALSEEQYRDNLQLWKEIRAIYEANRVTNYNEANLISLMDWKMPRRLAGPRFLRRSGDVPEFCAGVPDDAWFEFSVNDFEQEKPGSRSFTVDDPASPYGKALRTADNHADRAFDLWLPDWSAADPAEAIPHYDVFVSVRAEGELSDDTPVARVALHDWTRRVERSTTYSFGELKGGYHWLTIEDVEVGPRMIVYLAPLKTDQGASLFVDRIILRPRPDGENFFTGKLDQNLLEGNQ
ncbi:DUF4838 domain-containing protein [Victivallis sp. Marseille-Q1083]|uniref:DUF4838 domain-containing protein n=1 Tax=Victivallis sp. Marseille-Q1083 TaxID=2717288 RepID=UPI00158D87DF|nr:DUF4838 domain-containing protein [Victivallis sp. Marseille-Q1083]